MVNLRWAWRDALSNLSNILESCSKSVPAFLTENERPHRTIPPLFGEHLTVKFGIFVHRLNRLAGTLRPKLSGNVNPAIGY